MTHPRTMSGFRLHRPADWTRGLNSAADDLERAADAVHAARDEPALLAALDDLARARGIFGRLLLARDKERRGGG